MVLSDASVQFMSYITLGISSAARSNGMLRNLAPILVAPGRSFSITSLDLAAELMPKVMYEMNWTDASLKTIKDAADLLTEQKKMKAPLDYAKYVYPDLLKKVRPEAVKITQMPPA